MFCLLFLFRVFCHWKQLYFCMVILSRDIYFGCFLNIFSSHRIIFLVIYFQQTDRNCCINCNTQFGEYHCGMCNLWMSLVCLTWNSAHILVLSVVASMHGVVYFHCVVSRKTLSICWEFCRARNPSIAIAVDFAVSEVSRHFVIATSAACASRLVSLILISASRTNIRTIVRFVAKTCSRRDSPPRTCPVVMRFTLIAFENWPALIIVVPFAKRRWCRSKAWRRLGRHVLEISRNIPCRQICNASLILCVMIARRRATH